MRWIKMGQVESHLEYERVIREREVRLEEGEEPDCITDFYLQEVGFLHFVFKGTLRVISFLKGLYV